MALVGPASRLRIHETARIDPYTVFDTTNGPITWAPNVWVQPFTRIEGPCSIAADTQLFRANLRGSVTIGPTCRIGGEVEAAIVHGDSNKYHEGFLGHAYVGQWVNLGAITSNSDLRNDYGEVLVPLQGDPIPTGQAKVGCFIGDHTRTGMGSMLNTGTSIGVMCNVLPAGILLPKHIPSFTAVLYGRVAPGFPIDQLFETARTVMGRRGKVFGEEEQQLYRTLHDQTRLERERAFQREQHRRGDAWPVAQARAATGRPPRDRTSPGTLDAAPVDRAFAPDSLPLHIRARPLAPDLRERRRSCVEREPEDRTAGPVPPDRGACLHRDARRKPRRWEHRRGPVSACLDRFHQAVIRPARGPVRPVPWVSSRRCDPASSVHRSPFTS